MNTDLIAQLEKLSPTEGEWKFDKDYFYINYYASLHIVDVSQNNLKLLSLAPTMRIAILDMAKEIERLQMKLGLATIELKSYRDKL